MPNIIIDAKTPEGKRTSISVDQYLYDLFSLAVDEPRAFIRESIAGGFETSAAIRFLILQHIVKPSLLKRYDQSLETQMDIDDI